MTEETDTTIYDLTGFQRDILLTLCSLDTPYGLKIKRTLEDKTGDDINHGRLYPNLDTLTEMDLVTKSELDQRTNLYEPTDRAYELFNYRHTEIGEVVSSDRGRSEPRETEPEAEPEPHAEAE